MTNRIEKMSWENMTLSTKSRREQGVRERGGENDYYGQKDKRRKSSCYRRMGPATAGREAVCFICNGTRHQHGQCPNHPLCYNCKCSGHKAMFCPAKKGLRNYGFGIPGAGFFNIHIPTKAREGKKAGPYCLWFRH